MKTAGIKTTPRPICAHCGKQYGRRDVTTEAARWHGRADEPPPYAGDKIVTSYRYHGQSATHYTVNQERFEAGMHSAFRTLWDGKTWITPYKPFCTLRCALDYAREAFRTFERRRAIPETAAEAEERKLKW